MGRKLDRRPGFGRALFAAGFALIGVAALSRLGGDWEPKFAPHTPPTDKYRLVHAIGNNETIVARGLSKQDCETRKEDNITVAEALGIHSERLGIGSITCLPESLFES